MPQYKVVPGPQGIVGDQCFGFLSSGSASQAKKAADAIAVIIQHEAKNGWVFHGLDSTIVHNACLGCFSKSTSELKLLVFVYEPEQAALQSQGYSQQPSPPPA